eukprot:362822-Chlamydomonas_euryale.AAC.6
MPPRTYRAPRLLGVAPWRPNASGSPPSKVEDHARRAAAAADRTRALARAPQGHIGAERKTVASGAACTLERHGLRCGQCGVGSGRRTHAVPGGHAPHALANGLASEEAALGRGRRLPAPFLRGIAGHRSTMSVQHFARDAQAFPETSYERSIGTVHGRRMGQTRTGREKGLTFFRTAHE